METESEEMEEWPEMQMDQHWPPAPPDMHGMGMGMGW